MAGGIGSRFWPMSTPNYPKQFIDVMGVGRSLIQLTVDRLKPICPVENMWVVTNEKYISIVMEQIPDMPVDNILSEPEARNTAPCIAYACWKIRKKNPKANIVVTPSDALVINTTEYQRVLSKALEFTSDKEAIVTIGIKPSRPETGYGYIAAANPTSVDEIYKVEAFKEKPDFATAEKYIAAGNYYWNAGIFVWNIDTISNAIRTFQPKLATIMDEMELSFYTDKEKDVVGRLFPTCDKISIDYAVMERTADAVVVPMDAGWSDVGSWSSLWEISAHTPEGNVHHGDVISHKTENSYVYAESGLVTTVGVKDLVVVQTKDAVLIADRNAVQDVKKVVEKIKADGRHEHHIHREVYRPWGKYDSIDAGDRYQVKRITVKPGEGLSVQMHHHRAEHWVVVAGTAKVTIDGEVKLLGENESIYIPLGATHCLENPGKIPLDLIEVRSGSYLEEDDIVRFQDRYGRV